MKLVVCGLISDCVPHATFDVVAAPGVQEEYFKHGNTDGKSYKEIIGRPMPCPPAFRDPQARLELLDELGIQRTMMYPTLAGLLEERLRDQPEVIPPVIHAFNRWLDEDWGFVYRDRIYSTPIISLPVLDEAIFELNWVLERGARAIFVRPAPVPGLRGPRSFALREFDPFWKRVEEAGVVTVLHVADSGYTRYANEWEGRGGEYRTFEPTGFGLVCVGHRAIEDAVASMSCHGLLSRFPDLKFAIVENGAGWLPGLFKELDAVYSKLPGQFMEHPVDAIRRTCFINPFHEDDPLDSVELLGADHVLFGSDYPHPEGMSNPRLYIHELEGLAEHDIAKVMGGNMAKLVGATQA